METSLHSHIIAIHIQERIDDATAARLARSVRPRKRRTLHFRLPRRTAPTPTGRVGAGPA